MIDTVLDRSIALGYGRPGLLVRERMPGWPPDPPRIDGETVLITGAASGLGLAAAVGFARLGARVHALARDDSRAAHAVKRIIAAVPHGDVTAGSCDVSDLEAVRSFGERFTAAETRLNVLVNNAGTMPADRTRSPEGTSSRSPPTSSPRSR